MLDTSTFAAYSICCRYLACCMAVQLYSPGLICTHAKCTTVTSAVRSSPWCTHTDSIWRDCHMYRPRTSLACPYTHPQRQSLSMQSSRQQSHTAINLCVDERLRERGSIITPCLTGLYREHICQALYSNHNSLGMRQGIATMPCASFRPCGQAPR